MLNIYDYQENSQIYGPEKRFVIWFQGCSLKCFGCWNKEMWSNNPKNLFSADEIIKFILYAKEIKGVTFIGGEPLDQNEDLLELTIKLKKLDYSIVLFTGYEKFELKKRYQKEIWKNSDIIISGRYIEKYRNINLQWRGSSNQKIIFNSKKYEKYILENSNFCEIEIKKSGEIIISGFPEKAFLENFNHQITKKNMNQEI
jgi:anaerobic ribonucleoside-triphosphate reductase activating protein